MECQIVYRVAAFVNDIRCPVRETVPTGSSVFKSATASNFFTRASATRVCLDWQFGARLHQCAPNAVVKLITYAADLLFPKAYWRRAVPRAFAMRGLR